jgi:hypothetical protein
VIGSLVMAIFAGIFIVLSSSALGIGLAVVGAVAGVILGVPLLGDAARRDTSAPQSSSERMLLVPFAVVLGMFLVPRLFDAIGLTLGWGLAAGASAFVATAGYTTSRSDEIFGASR